MKNQVIKYAVLNALGTAAYIALVASFLFYAPTLFGGDGKDVVLIPMAMISLFVLSASITGSLVLGRPIIWFLDGKKKEAVSLLIATIGCLFVITVLAFAGLALMGGERVVPV